MSEALWQHLQILTELKAPSGREDPVRDYLAREFLPHAAELAVDPLGNLIATAGPEGAPAIVIAAHMDEVSLAVKGIDRSGCVYFEKMGIIDDKVLPGREVDILTPQGPVRGVIGSKSSHLLTEAELGRLSSYREMWIDVGAATREEALALGISPGCGVTYVTACQRLAGHAILAKSLDARIGCAVMLEAFKEVASSDVVRQARVVAIGTVQEEIGARGAAVACHGLNPTLAIVLDTVPCENPTAPESAQTLRLGAGPVIRTIDFHYPTMRGCVTPRAIEDLLLRAAASAGVPYQVDCLTGTFLDSSSLQLTKGGIPTGAICFPRRYSHSPVEVGDFRDVVGGLKLLVAAIREFAQQPPRFSVRLK